MNLKIGIIGSRTRDSSEDCTKLEKKFVEVLESKLGKYKGNIKYYTRNVTIVTGDCDRGGDFFAKYLANIYRTDLIIKRIKDPRTKKELSFHEHRYFDYFTMCKIFYKRDEEIAKEDLNYLLCLVAKDRKGGTEKTIEYFKKYHKDWEKKLILI